MHMRSIRFLLAAMAALSLTGATTIAAAHPTTQHAAKHRKHRRHHRGIPQHNGGDRDADNNGGPSDGDGNL